MNRELQKYLQNHDLDAEEEELLQEWVRTGHNVNSNPDQEFDDYGKEVPYMRWYWGKQDPHCPRLRKEQLREAMILSHDSEDLNEYVNYLISAQRIMRDEIVMYRRFLAQFPGAVAEYEHYRSEHTARRENEQE